MKIIKELGRGGTSKVYLAYDQKLQRYVTLKFVKDGTCESASEVFASEVEILKRLGGNGGPELLGVEKEYIKISYVSGEDLLSILKKKGKLKEKEALKYTADLAETLRILHERNEPIIYRDLKPANIIIGDDGKARLIDYGAARIFRDDVEADTVNLGTVGYAAPEQFGSLGQSSQQTDIYCLGMTLLQMVSGTNLKDSSRLNEIKKKGIRGVSPETLDVVYRCIKPSRKERYKNCREIEKAIKKVPERVRHRKMLRYLKIGVVSAIVAMVISFSASYYDQVKEFVTCDVEQRLPAVKMRFYNAKQRIDGALEAIEEER